jgi:hypothetical protein
MRGVMFGLGLIAATGAYAQTVQQRFDAARTKLEAEDAVGALADLDALEAHLRAQPKPNETNLAITRTQKADALIRLGRADEARPLLRAALGGSGLAKPALKPLRDNASLLLTGMMEGDLDHAGARAAYAQLANEAAEPITRTLALMGVSRTAMFTDAPAALRHIDQALAIAEKDLAVGKRALANVLGLKGRILLNAGKNAEARALLVRAVELRGGLTQKVNQSDVSLRADAAIAMLRLGQDELARKYLAYTGAGRTDEQLQPPVEMPLPACGNGLEPKDSAVIEFTILNDGRVVSPRPIFASKQGDAAYEFARHVGRWSWDAENVAKVKGFFRLATRVELRCTTAAQRPALTAALEQAAETWFVERGVKPVQLAPDAVMAVNLTRQLQAAGATPLERLQAAMWLAGNKAVEEDARQAHAAEAASLAAKLQAPASVRFLIAFQQARNEADRGTTTWRESAARLMDSLPRLRATPHFAEPEMQAVLNLELAQAAGVLRRSAEEQEALLNVANGAGLSDKHPLKVAALVQLANLYAATKQTELAAAMYDRTGLTAKQCALVDGGPVMLKSGTGSFPNAAQMWGFEGWTSLEYDVAADGTTRNARAVAAFPPSVFAEASEAIPRTIRYRVSYRPEGDLACTAMKRRVRFSLP